MEQAVDIDAMLRLADQLERAAGARGPTGVGTRVDADAGIIVRMLDARETLSTGTLIAVFEATFAASREAAKTRVSLALRKLVDEQRATRIKQGLYRSTARKGQA